MRIQFFNQFCCYLFSLFFLSFSLCCDFFFVLFNKIVTCFQSPRLYKLYPKKSNNTFFHAVSMREYFLFGLYCWYCRKKTVFISLQHKINSSIRIYLISLMMRDGPNRNISCVHRMYFATLSLRVCRSTEFKLALYIHAYLAEIHFAHTRSLTFSLLCSLYLLLSH